MNEERVALLQKYISEEPDNPFNIYALSMEYYTSDSSLAIQLLSQLLEEHPMYLPTYFKAAQLFWEMEKWDKADRTFKLGIALAKELGEHKALSELQSAFQNFLFDRD